MPRMKPIEPYATPWKEISRRLRKDTMDPEERTAAIEVRNWLYILAHNDRPPPGVLISLDIATEKLERVRKHS